jgi:hypothetical protein
MEALFYIIGLLPYAFAIGFGLAIPLLVLGAYNHFSVGVGLVAFAFVLDTVNLSQPLLRIGLTIFPPDLPMILLGAVAGLRWMLRSDIPRRHAVWVFFVLLFFVDLGIGIARHGTTAGVQARPDYYAIAAATYAMSFPVGVTQVRKVIRTITALSVAMLLLSSYRWIVYYTPITSLLPPGGVYNNDGPSRVIGSNFALVIAQALVLGLFFAGRGQGSTVARWLSPLLLAGTLVLQHRSVWLATIVGVLMSILLARTQRAPLWQQLVLATLVATTAAAPLLMNQSVTEQVETSAQRALAGQDTVYARVSNWRSTLQQWRDDGPRAILIGRELGSDTARFIDTESGQQLRIKFGIHNQYITVLTQTGVLGLAAMIWIYGYVLLGLWRLCHRGDENSSFSAVLLVLVGMQLIYYIAYGVDFVQHLVFGLALAWVAGHATVRAMGAVRTPKAPLQSRPSGA